MAMADRVEVEISAPKNRSMHFPPIKRKIRGRIDWTRATRLLTRTEELKYGDHIPGQVLGYDPKTKECYIREPLHDNAYRMARTEIQKRFRLEPEYQLITVEPATMIYWMQRAVDSGHAQMVKGREWPKVEGKPQIDFYTSPKKPSATDIANAIAWVSLPEDKRQKAAELLGCNPY